MELEHRPVPDRREMPGPRSQREGLVALAEQAVGRPTSGVPQPVDADRRGRLCDLVLVDALRDGGDVEHVPQRIERLVEPGMRREGERVMHRVERFEAVDADGRRPGCGEHLRRGEPAGVRRPPEGFVHLHLEPDRRPLERDLVVMLAGTPPRRQPRRTHSETKGAVSPP